MDNYPPHIQQALDQIKSKLYGMLGKYEGQTTDEVREKIQSQLEDFLRDAEGVRTVYRSDMSTLCSRGRFVEWKAYSVVGVAQKTLRKRVVRGLRKTRVNIKRLYDNPNLVILDVLYEPKALGEITQLHIEDNNLI